MMNSISINHINQDIKWNVLVSFELLIEAEDVMAAKYSFLPTDASTPERYKTNVLSI